MSNVKKPDPVAYLRKDELKRLGVPATTGMSAHHVSDSALLRAKATKELAEKYGHSIPVVTTDQAEAYANALAAERVREALEQAAAAVERHDKKGREFVKGSLWDQLSKEASDRIRALIPKQ